MEVILSVFSAFDWSSVVLFQSSFILTVLLFPRKQDLYGLERALITVIISILVSMADTTFLLVPLGLNFMTLASSMFAMSAVFVVLAYMCWRGVAQSERLAAPGRANSVLLPTVAATICLFLALSGGTLLLYLHPNQFSYGEFYVMDSNRQTVAYPTNLTHERLPL